jgi:hypothetical protein
MTVWSRQRNRLWRQRPTWRPRVRVWGSTALFWNEEGELFDGRFQLVKPLATRTDGFKPSWNHIKVVWNLLIKNYHQCGKESRQSKLYLCYDIATCFSFCIKPQSGDLTLNLLMSYIYGAPCKAINFNVVYICTYVWQHWKPSLSICCTIFQHRINAELFLCHSCV